MVVGIVDATGDALRLAREVSPKKKHCDCRARL